MSASDQPSAISSRMNSTDRRVPLMTGLPTKTARSAVMYSRQFIRTARYLGYALLAKPNFALSTLLPLLRIATKLMSDKITDLGITSVLQEKRVFPPPKEFSQRAHIKSLAQYRRLYNESIRSPDKFWAKQAKQELVWFKPWKKVLQWKAPFAKWFVGGRLNLSVNCLDCHLDTSLANKA